MCVAIIVPDKASFPDAETLNACAAQNPNGGGVAWIDNGEVRFEKGLTTEVILQMIEQAFIKAPAFLHFRIATAGGVRPELTHPFPILRGAPIALSGTAPAVLMHNGHWSKWSETVLSLARGKFLPGPWSDTRAMAYLAFWYGTGILELIDEKVAVLNADGSIERYGKGWTERNGCHFSNTHWEIKHWTQEHIGYHPGPMYYGKRSRSEWANQRNKGAYHRDRDGSWTPNEWEHQFDDNHGNTQKLLNEAKKIDTGTFRGATIINVLEVKEDETSKLMKELTDDDVSKLATELMQDDVTEDFSTVNKACGILASAPNPSRKL